MHVSVPSLKVLVDKLAGVPCRLTTEIESASRTHRTLRSQRPSRSDFPRADVAGCRSLLETNVRIGRTPVSLCDSTNGRCSLKAAVDVALGRRAVMGRLRQFVVGQGAASLSPLKESGIRPKGRGHETVAHRTLSRNGGRSYAREEWRRSPRTIVSSDPARALHDVPHPLRTGTPQILVCNRDGRRATISADCPKKRRMTTNRNGCFSGAQCRR